jgi:hypothetical protein
MTVTALNSSKPSRYDYLLEVIDDELVQRPTAEALLEVER